MTDYPPGSLVLHLWIGSPYQVIITPAGLRHFYRDKTADDVLSAMVERKQVGAYQGEHIMPLPLVAQHGLLNDKDFIAFTPDGTIVTGPCEWGRA